MPYKDPDTRRQFMRQYQLEYMWRRRWTWILENGPCNRCGSVNNLQVSFKDPDDKTVKVASIWSRSDEARTELLAQCEVLCGTCHKRKISLWRAVKAAVKAVNKGGDMPKRR